MSEVAPEELARRLVDSYPQLRTLPAGVLAVGGAVRDLLAGRVPADVDLVVDHGAKEIARNFARDHGYRFVDLGRERFPTYRVVAPEHEFDFNDVIGDSLHKDLLRRDFTVDAIALALDGSALHDPCRGREDLRSHLLRMVREANLDDDPLRILKGVRMVADLGFTIEPQTFRAMRQHAPKIGRSAPERITSEIDRILSGARRGEAIGLMTSLALDGAIFGRAIDESVVAPLASLRSGDLVLAYSVLLRDRTPEEIDAIASRLRWSEQRRRGVLTLRALARALSSGAASDDGSLAVALYDAGVDAGSRVAGYLEAEGFAPLAERVGRFVAERGEALFSIEPLLSGDEIAVACAIEPGPLVGRIKRHIVEAQLRGEVATREEAMILARAMV